MQKTVARNAWAHLDRRLLLSTHSHVAAPTTTCAFTLRRVPYVTTTTTSLDADKGMCVVCRATNYKIKSLNMQPSLLLFLQETHRDGEVDAQVFVACVKRPQKLAKFYVYMTRASLGDARHNWRPIAGSRVSRSEETPMIPMVTLTFISVEQVLNCLNVVFGLSTASTKVSCEVHCTPNYNPTMNFKDLWAMTGPGTELGAYDNVSDDLVQFLRLLADSRVLEAGMSE